MSYNVPMTTNRTTLKNIELDGQTTTVRTNRRYAVVVVRPTPVKVERGTLVAFAEVRSTTDSARKAFFDAVLTDLGLGMSAAVVDTETGEVIR